MAGIHVSFAGPVPHHEVATFLRQSDVLVQSSVWDEPFGIPAVEAMAAGLPVIASRSGALPEIVVDQTTGLLVEPNSAIALADAMIALIQEQTKARTFGSAGEARARALFSWDVVVARLSCLYQALISGLPLETLSATSSEQSVNSLGRPSPGSYRVAHG
jgi:glycosyltransferase involved in cell wall biosynthesis